MRAPKQKLEQAHLDDLRKSGLNAELAHKLHIKSLGPEKYRLTYFDEDGRPTEFYRDRHFYNNEHLAKLKRAKKKAPPKYTQSAGTEPHTYLPPLLPWRKVFKNPTIELVFTEGEKKSARACANGIACIGLGGTWSWRSRKRALQILPQLNAIAWEGRVVRVVLDSDCHRNDGARKGGEWFVAELNKRGAKAVIVILPPDTDDPDKKVSLDDYIVKYGAEAMMKLLADPTSVQAEPWMEQLNSKIAVILDTGEFVALDSGKVYGNTALHNVYGNRGNLNAWIKWAGRRGVRRLVFEPGAPSGVTPNGDYNTFPGWTTEPVKCTAKDVQPFLVLLRRVLPEATEEERRWVVCWFGYPLKYPGTKLNTALLLWSSQHGTGKNALGVSMRYIYGHAWGKVDGMEIAGAFNEWALGKLFVVADELKIGDRRGLTNKLKDMVTRDRLRINSKNQRTYEVDDHINYLLTSNHPDAMFVEVNDRRMAIFHASEERLPVEIWDGYESWLKGGGAAKLRYYFENILDYSAFNPRGAAPVTTAKQEMIESGRSDVEAWISDLQRNPDNVLRTPYDLYRTDELHKAYDPEGRRNIGTNGFATKLGGAKIPRALQNHTLIEGVRQRLWIVRGDVATYQRMTPKRLADAYQAERDIANSRTAREKWEGRVN